MCNELDPNLLVVCIFWGVVILVILGFVAVAWKKG